MKAVVQDRYGKADSLKLGDAEMPVVDATSVLLRVRSASVNSLDWRIMSGKPIILRFLGFGLTRPKRRIRGVDVAGEVIAVRKPDSRFKVGDAVFGLGSGSFAEYVAADERELTNQPDGVSFDDAATLGIAACTALQGLRDRGHVQPGQSVAIAGAGSGVGTFAVQLAKWMGARVTAITRAENVELLRSAGADVVLDYDKADFTCGPDRYDVIVDFSGLKGIGALLRALKPGGTLVVAGGRGGFGRIIQAGLRSPAASSTRLGPSREVKLGGSSEARQSRSPGEAETRHRPRPLAPGSAGGDGPSRSPPGARKTGNSRFLSRSGFRSDLQYVIKESGDLAIHCGPLGTEACPLLDLPESGQDRAVEVLRAAALHRSFDHEFRSMLSDLTAGEHFVEDWPYTLGAIRAHSGDVVGIDLRSRSPSN